MRFHQPTIEYVTRRTTEGFSKRDIIHCLKRYVIREVFHLVCPAENAVLKTSWQPLEYQRGSGNRDWPVQE